MPTALVPVETEGDRRTDVSLDRIGGQGVFVKEVQAAVVRGEADAAVHSAKDLPASEPTGATGLLLASVPERADPRDVLVGATLASLPSGAMVATGSPRRRSQLANLRPDLTFADLRGNLATRLAAVGTRGIHAVVVARAALDRLGWTAPEGVETEVLEPHVMVPQVGQGALAVECREDDLGTREALGAVEDAVARPLVDAERAFLAELGGGCDVPVGALATWAGTSAARPIGPGPAPTDGGPDGIELTGVVASADGRVVLRHAEVGRDPGPLGRAVARALLDGAGGRQLGPWSTPDHRHADAPRAGTR